MEATATQDRLVLQLPQPDSSLVKNLMGLTKDELKELLRPLRETMKDTDVECQAGLGAYELQSSFYKLPNYVEFSSMSKDSLTRLYASLISSTENTVRLTERFPDYRSAWMQILTNPEVQSDRIEKLIGRRVVYLLCRCGYNVVSMIEPFFAPAVAYDFKRSYRLGETLCKISVSPEPRRRLLEALVGPDVLNVEVRKELPSDQSLDVANCESDIPGDLQYLNGLVLTGNLLNDKGGMPNARLKKLNAANVVLQFPGRGENAVVPDRLEMLAYAYSRFHKSEGRKRGEADQGVDDILKRWARFVADDYGFGMTHQEVGSFFPEYVGINKTWGSEPEAHGMVRNLVSILMTAQGDWLATENLWLNYLCFPVGSWGSDTVRHLFGPRARARHALRPRNWGASMQTIYAVDWCREIDFKFLIRWLVFLCAAGLAELAYVYNPSPDDICEGIRYVRLTPLGRYAFGLADHYEAGKSKKMFEYDYDDLNNVLTILSENSPYTHFLARIGRQIGANRYRITPESMVRNSKDANEVKRNIENLKRIVKVDSHPTLQETVKEALERIACCDDIKESYTLFRIRKDLPGLAELIVKNPAIRSKVILAEHSIVLVGNSYLDRFRNICHEAGYII